MRKLKSVITLAGIMLLILSAASLYVVLPLSSEVRPADSYEDKGVRTFAPYDVLPVQVQNTSASSRDRRMNPTKTVYMVYYRATDGSGYKWSDEVPAKSYGESVVEAGETVERRVLSIPEAGTYITVESGQTAESYTEELREKYNRIIGLSVSYIFVYAAAWAILLVRKRLRREKRETDDFGLSQQETYRAASFGPEAQEAKPRRRGVKWLLIGAPIILLAVFVVIGVSRGGSEAPEVDFGWDGSVWTSDVLGLRYTLPTSGEKYDVGEANAEREAEFGSRNSAGKIVLSVLDSAEWSTLSLTVVPGSQPSEADLQARVEQFAQRAAQDGSYDLAALGEETLAGQTWQAWRIETPERGLVHYYLSRQSGAFWLILLSYGPMAETPPALLTCFEGETSFEQPTVNTYAPPANEDGFLVATFPPALLGNETPEELVAAFQEDRAKAQEEMTPEELEAESYWSNVVANEDGSVSYYFTPDQYQRTKEGYYSYGTHVFDTDWFGFNPSDILRRLEYTQIDENHIPWEVTAWVDLAYFQSGGTFSDFVASFIPMTMIGRYQIMCGVPAEEWAVHVIVRDVETEEVLYEEDFPEKA